MNNSQKTKSSSWLAASLCQSRAALRSHPSNQAAYVTNAISGTVSVVDLNLRGPSARLLTKEKLTFKAKLSASQSLNSGVGHPPVIETRPIISDGTAEMAQSSSGVGAFATTGDLP